MKNSKKHQKNHKNTVSTRQGGAKYTMYGKHACMAALQNSRRHIERVYITGKWDGDSALAGHSLALVTNEEMGDMLPVPTPPHQGIAMVVRPLPSVQIDRLISRKPRVVLALDSVTDPQNIGAMLRSCMGFDVGAMLMPSHNAPREGAVMAKIASGALEHIDMVYESNLARAIDKLKTAGYWAVGLDMGGTHDMRALPDFERVVLVAGSEGRGLRPGVRKACDVIASVNMSDRLESLNVSHATTIALYELYSSL